MDTFLSRQVGFLALAFFSVSSLFVPSVASAQHSDTEAQAMAYCQNTPAVKSNPDTWRCVDLGQQNGGTEGLVDLQNWNDYYQAWRESGGYGYTYSAPSTNPCDGVQPAARILVDSAVTGGSTLCSQSPSKSGGASTSCAVNETPIGAPTYNFNTGKMQTLVRLESSGNVCSGAPGSVQDAHGAPAPAQPKAATLPAVNVTAPPSICGGGSCYNAADDTYTVANADGTQTSVKGSAARGAGGCGSSGDTTLCAGPVDAPKPPVAAIPDPPTQIQSSDKYQQRDPVSGAPVSVQVVSYSSSTPTTSGAKTGDSTPGNPTGVPASSSTAPAPASASSSASKGSYGGGQDCASPPACTGDAVVCGAARTQWGTTCQLHTDLTGDGKPTDLDSLKTKYGQNDAWIDRPTGNTVGDQANSGTYDRAGFGYGTTCPMIDLNVPLMGGPGFNIPFSSMCFVGGWIRSMVIAFALFFAARITWGGVA